MAATKVRLPRKGDVVTHGPALMCLLDSDEMETRMVVASNPVKDPSTGQVTVTIFKGAQTVPVDVTDLRLVSDED